MVCQEPGAARAGSHTSVQSNGMGCSCLSLPARHVWKMSNVGAIVFRWQSPRLINPWNTPPRLTVSVHWLCIKKFVC